MTTPETPLDAVSAQLALVDPTTSPTTLAAIAQAFPELRVAVAVHANAYPALLDWLFDCGDPDVQKVVTQRRSANFLPTPPAPPSLPAQSPANPAAKPAAASNTPTHKAHRKLIPVVAGSSIIVIALVVWLVVLPLFTGSNNGTNETAGPSVPDILTQPTWSAPLQLSDLPTDYQSNNDDYDVYSSGLANIAILVWEGDYYDSGIGDYLFKGVDLQTRKELWQSEQTRVGYGVDSSGKGLVVLTDAGQLQVFDPRTGHISANADNLDTSERLNEVVAGFAITEKNGTLCARPMNDPNQCKWQAKTRVGRGYGSFGNGRWINTGDGVLEMATGEPASFGADVASNQTGASGDHLVYYYGPSADRVFRLTEDSDGTQNGTRDTLQVWDTTNNIGLFSPINGGIVGSNASSPVFVLFDNGYRANSIQQYSAYSWNTGEVQWRLDMPQSIISTINTSLFGGSAPYLVVNYYLANASGESTIAVDEGQTVWSDSGSWPIAAGQQVIYLASPDNQLVAFDGGSNDFTQLWSIDMPDDPLGFDAGDTSVVAGHIFVYSVATNQLYVLID